MKSSEGLHYSTFGRVVRSILFVAMVTALAVLVVDMYQQRKGVPPAPGTERTAPTAHSNSDQAFV